MDTPVSPDESGDLEQAIALHEAGRLAEAEALYCTVLLNDPNEPDALNLLGVILQDRGDIAQSIALISRALALVPDFPEALTNLARAQRAGGRSDLAAENAARAMAQDPSLPEAPFILCRALLDVGDYRGAADAGRQAVTLAPGSYDAHACLGMALEHLTDMAGAATAYRAALEIEPDRAVTQVMLGSILSGLGRDEQAVHHFRLAAALAPGEVPPHIGLGTILQRIEDVTGSIDAFRRALELAPGRADVWRMQGGNFDAIGRFDDAAVCYKRSLELDPSSAEAQRSLARIGRLDNPSGEIIRLEALVQSDAESTWSRIIAGFALGTLNDKLGAYDRAFAAFETANTRALRYHAEKGESFDPAALRRDVDGRIRKFDRAALAIGRLKGDLSEQPVFVVGMPRSGTTLVEQIAASHGRIRGMGETMDIWGMVKRLEARQPGIHPSLWDREAVQRETKAHLAHLRAASGDADRVIDKLPDNVMMLGYIAMLFPRARVIVCRRDPRDVCLSCYFQQFNDATPWSLDLADCAIRMREVSRLMDFWCSVQPLRILEMHYEALVGDLEGQSRRLIDFLGLDWDPACLDFHKTDRKVMSASQWQVRQPIYGSSAGRWRQYRRHLGPMLAVLGDIVGDKGHGV